MINIPRLIGFDKPKPADDAPAAMSRRGFLAAFLAGTAAAAAAPAIIRSGILMPVKPLVIERQKLIVADWAQGMTAEQVIGKLDNELGTEGPHWVAGHQVYIYDTLLEPGMKFRTNQNPGLGWIPADGNAARKMDAHIQSLRDSAPDGGIRFSGIDPVVLRDLSWRKLLLD